jgi:hypothetical protein
MFGNFRWLFYLLLISYIPQYIKIISQKSTAGISTAFVELHVAANFALMGTVLTTDHCIKVMRCFINDKISEQSMRDGLMPMWQCAALLFASLGLWVVPFLAFSTFTNHVLPALLSF